MLKYILIILLALIYLGARGQSNGFKFESPISPSPNAASLGKYGDIPTSNYTGVPFINIPIYDIKVGNNVIPINISYHAGGFKVSDEASWVGLGWSLNAGGVITRAKKSMNDLSPKGYYKKQDHSKADGNDKEPDMFYFNFLNFSGKFIIDYSSNPSQPYTIRIVGSYNDDNLKIKLINENSWTITDKYGMIYEFNVSEWTNENITSSAGSLYILPDDPNFISSWFLSKIVYTNGEEVSFNYGDGPQIESQPAIDRVFSRRNGIVGSYSSKCPPLNFQDVSGTELIITTDIAKISTKVLQGIIFSGGKIIFNSVNDRMDLKCNSGSAPRLSDIKVYSQNNSGFDLLKTFNFYQTYFETSANENSLSKRLKLDKLSSVGGGTGVPQDHVFLYNNIMLPDKNSQDMDHWGYYNGPNNNISLFPSIAQRNPSDQYVKACLLEAIIYPTMGKTTFAFEINDFSNLGTALNWSSANSSGTGMIGSGVRVRKIVNSDFNNNYNIYSQRGFEYLTMINGNSVSSGRIMSKINYTTSFVTKPVSYHCGDEFGSYMFRGNVEYSSSSIAISGDAQGNAIGYDRVTIKDIGGSKDRTTIEEFNNYSSASLQEYPRMPSTNNNLNGLIKSQTYNANKNDVDYPVKKLEYEYNVQSNDVVKHYVLFSGPGGSYFVSYDLACEWITCNKITEKQFYPSSSVVSYVKATNFAYDPTTRQKKQEDFIDSKNVPYATKYLYPRDLVLQGLNNPYQTMLDRNMFGFVIQVEHYKNSLLLDRAYTDYATGWPKNLNLILPISARSQYMANAPEKRLNYNAYDNRGNAIDISYEKGAKTSYLWSYDRHYPIAEIKNSDYTEIENILGVANINSFANQIAPGKTAVDAFLAPLKTSLLNIQMTAYAYKPLVGIVSQTDINGQSLYYEYDDFQRLKYIKDNDNNIVKKYDYGFSQPYFYNDFISYPYFAKLDCGVDQIGESVPYSIPANTFFSIISKADANSKANAELFSRGQAHADSVGTCIPASMSISYNYSPVKQNICNYAASADIVQRVTCYYKFSTEGNPVTKEIYRDKYLTQLAPTGFYQQVNDFNLPITYSYIKDGFLIFTNRCGQHDPLIFTYSSTLVNENMCSVTGLETKGIFVQYPSQTLFIGSMLYQDYELLTFADDGFYLNGGNIYTVSGGVIVNISACTIVTQPAEIKTAMLKHSLIITEMCKTGLIAEPCYYTGGTIAVGTTLYKQSDLTTQAPPGYYGDGTYVYTIDGNGLVNARQSCSSVNAGDYLYHPPFIVGGVTLEPGYATQRSVICDPRAVLLTIPLFSDLGLDRLITFDQPLFYADEEHSQIALDGYYTLYETDINHNGFKFYYIQDGILVFSNWCDQTDPRY